MSMSIEKSKLEECINSKYLKYTYNKEQKKQLRRLALEKFGAERIALLDSEEIDELFNKEQIIPVVISGIPSSGVFLMKADVLADCEFITEIENESHES